MGVEQDRVQGEPDAETGQTSRPIRVLEIGCGKPDKAAVNTGGELFKNPNLHYVGIDLPQQFEKYSIPDEETESTSESCIRSFRAMDSAALQFPDDSFDLVLVRSMFGQFRDDKRLLRSTRHHAELGLYEAFRVLKPGGRIVIAEENTPEDIDDVEIDLRNSGFEPLDYAFMKTRYGKKVPNDKWLNLRKEFYNDMPVQPRPDPYLGTPYILIARKPAQPDYEELEAGFLVTRIVTDETRSQDEQEIKRFVYKKGKNKFPGIVPSRYV